MGVGPRPIEMPTGCAVTVKACTGNALASKRRELCFASPQHFGIPRWKHHCVAERCSQFTATKDQLNEVSLQLGPIHARGRNRLAVIKRRAPEGHCPSKQFGIIFWRAAQAREPDSRAERWAARSSKDSACPVCAGGLLYSSRPPPRREQRPAGGAVPFERQSKNLTRRKEAPRARVHRNLCRRSAQSLGRRS